MNRGIRVLLRIALDAKSRTSTTMYMFQKELRIPIAPFKGLRIEDTSNGPISNIEVIIKEVTCKPLPIKTILCWCEPEILEDETDLQARVKLFQQDQWEPFGFIG